MKKIFAVMLALAMLLSMAAFAEAADFLGIWFLASMEMDGATYSPADFGMSMMMELREDGTAYSEQAMGEDSQVAEGTWAQDGDAIVVTIDDSPASFTLQDGQLVAEEEGQIMVFSREPVEAEVYVPAAVVAAEEADFNGAWTAFKVGMAGVYYDAAMIGMDMNAEFTDGSLLLTGFFGSDTPIPMTFADGAYSFETSDESEMFAAIRAEMLEDGNLQVTMTAAEDVVLIMAPAEEEEEPAA